MPAEIAAAAVMAEGPIPEPEPGKAGALQRSTAGLNRGEATEMRSSSRQPWVRRQPGTRTEGKRIEQMSRGRFPREPANDCFPELRQGIPRDWPEEGRVSRVGGSLPGPSTGRQQVALLRSSLRRPSYRRAARARSAPVGPRPQGAPSGPSPATGKRSPQRR